MPREIKTNLEGRYVNVFTGTVLSNPAQSKVFLLITKTIQPCFDDNGLYAGLLINGKLISKEQIIAQREIFLR